MTPEPRELEVPADAAGQRLDLFLAAADERLSRSRARAEIDAGRVTVDGQPARPSHRVRAGERLRWSPVAPEPLDALPEDLPLVILHEDGDLLVLDKPVGMVTHPARGARSGTLVNALLAHCADLSGIGGVLRPGIVHRLDRDTSGLLVVAKHDQAHRHLSAQLQARTAGRVYLALVHGEPSWTELRVDAPLGRHPRRRLEIAVRTDGRPAATRFELLERFAVAALLRCRLETGRTHQVRVHAAHVGHPLLGDPLYGARRAARQPLPEPLAAAVAALGGQALHAAELDFRHPRDERPMHFEAPPPAPFRALLTVLRDGPTAAPAAPAARD